MLLSIKFKCIISFVLSVYVTFAKSQGNFCYTPFNLPGICVVLSKCPSLGAFYQQLGADFLRNSQTPCGQEYINNDPLVCCTDPLNENLPLTHLTDPIIIKRQTGDQNSLNLHIGNTFGNHELHGNGLGYWVYGRGRRHRHRHRHIRGRLLTPDEDCGVTRVTTSTRIVGGAQAKRGSWPWVALLGYTDNLGERSWRCGGTLITTRHVLTAAHCITRTLTVIRLGEHKINRDDDRHLQNFGILDAVRYPGFNQTDGTGDVGIVYLDGDAELTRRVNPICLPVDPVNNRNLESISSYYAAGWGRTTEGGQPSQVLMEVELPALDLSVCKETYKKNNKLLSEKQFNDGVLCAGDLAGGGDTCQGDSGGPLMSPIQGRSEINYYQQGIVSYGIGCGRAGIPAVFSRVSHYVDWIKERVNDDI